MRTSDVISMALKNLFKRKLRTFLTVLGVIVGTAAIISMISLGIGMNKNFLKSLERMGDIMTVTVRKPYEYDMVGMAGGMSVYSQSSSSKKNTIILDDAAIYSFEKLPGVVAATPFLEINLKAVSGKFESWLQIRGLSPKAMQALGYVAKDGRLLEENDKLNVVFGSEAPFYFYNPNQRGGNYGYYDPFAQETEERVPDVNVMEDKIQMSFDYMFGNKNPIYQDENAKKAKPYTIKGVGILKSKSWNDDGFVYMNIEEVQKIKLAQEKYEASLNQGQGGSNNNKQKTKGYDTALVKCKTLDDVKKVEKLIQEMGYEAYSLSQNLESMQEMSNSLQGLLGAVGAVSLFVAAIGISNTMVMSIYERTREIGIMKVIGASLKDIKKLFLLEASLIGFLGGMFGVGLSLIVSKIINMVGISFLEMQTYGEKSDISSVPLWLCFAALGFATIIGLISGYFPARRATKLSALTAIKTE